jgi:hypothetical protein
VRAQTECTTTADRHNDQRYSLISCSGTSGVMVISVVEMNGGIDSQLGCGAVRGLRRGVLSEDVGQRQDRDSDDEAQRDRRPVAARRRLPFRPALCGGVRVQRR